jgi:hypothetical protein
MQYSLGFTIEGHRVVTIGRFGEWEWEPEEEQAVGSATPPPSCNHEWVNIGFNHIRIACKHCGVDKLGKD